MGVVGIVCHVLVLPNNITLSV